MGVSLQFSIVKRAQIEQLLGSKVTLAEISQIFSPFLLKEAYSRKKIQT